MASAEHSARIARAAAAGLIGAVLAFGTPCAADDGDRARLIEQKTRLVETLLKSPKAREGARSGPPEARKLYEVASERLDAAREAAAGGNHERANQALDEALRALTAVSSRTAAGDSALADSARRAENEALREQVQLYRAALAETVRARPTADGAGARDLERVDALLAAAAEASAAGRHGQANKALAEAYAAVAASLARLRAGETVVLSLKFDQPADEYAYEVKRYDSHRMLVDLTLAEKRSGAEARELVERRVEESRKLRARAEAEASQGDHTRAIATMEEATLRLVRALQALGVPAF